GEHTRAARFVEPRVDVPRLESRSIPRFDERGEQKPSAVIAPPVEPMLAKLADEVPPGAFLYEPKWDGFRAIVFRAPADVFIQSRDLRPLDRYFPELHD